MRMITSLAAGLLAAGATAATGIGHVAHAHQSFETARTVAVHYGDLDLGSSAGRDALAHRIRQAVRTACGIASPSDLQGQNDVADCRRDLTAGLAAERDAAIAAVRTTGTPTLVARR